MEIKKCVRCGVFFASEVEVCQNCIKKDNADVNKLKGFLMDSVSGEVTKTEVANSTGITMKNLNRFLNANEFKGYNIPETLSNKEIKTEKVITKV